MPVGPPTPPNGNRARRGQARFTKRSPAVMPPPGPLEERQDRPRPLALRPSPTRPPITRERLEARAAVPTRLAAEAAVVLAALMPMAAVAQLRPSREGVEAAVVVPPMPVRTLAAPLAEPEATARPGLAAPPVTAVPAVPEAEAVTAGRIRRPAMAGRAAISRQQAR